MNYLERVCRELENAGVKYALVGGYAVALHGAVRGTLDIDVALRWTYENLIAAEEALNSAGLRSRLPISANDMYYFRNEYIENRNLIAWTFYNPNDPLEQLDIIVTYDLTGKSVRQVQLTTGPVHVLSLEDLIEMKRTSARPQDLEDVAALEKFR